MARFMVRGPTLSVRAKITLLVVVALVASVAPATLAVWVAQDFKRTIDAIYADKIVPLEKLQRVEEFLREVELRIPGVMSDWFSGPGAKAYIDSALPHMRGVWNEVSGRTHEGSTAALIREVDEAFGRFQALVPRLTAALGREDKQSLSAISDEWLDIKPRLLKPLGALVTAARDDVAREVKTTEERLRRAIWLIAAGLGAFIALIVPISVGLVQGISTPLGNTVRLLRELAGNLAEGRGDLTIRLEAGRHDEIGEVSRSFNVFMEKLHDLVSHVKRTGIELASASRQLAGATERLATAAQEEASSLEETAASLEEITGAVRQNADNARQADQLASGSQDTAQAGGQVVASAVASMEEITRASRRIVEIITAIDEIAFQTNLLALNAAVEAARAGDQGRGFAVVASEVRSLAQRSAVAAKEIKALIQDSVGKVESGAALVGRSGQTLQEIVASAKHVTSVIAEIAAASQEQARGIDQLGRTVSQMDQTVQENAAQSEELASTAQSLADQAARLETLVAQFKLDNGATSERLAAAERPVVRSGGAAGAAPRRRRAPSLTLVPAARRVAGTAGNGFEGF